MGIGHDALDGADHGTLDASLVPTVVASGCYLSVLQGDEFAQIKHVVVRVGRLPRVMHAFCRRLFLMPYSISQRGMPEILYRRSWMFWGIPILARDRRQHERAMLS